MKQIMAGSGNGGCMTRGTICSFIPVYGGPYAQNSFGTCCSGTACMGAHGTIPTCTTP